MSNCSYPSCQMGGAGCPDEDKCDSSDGMQSRATAFAATSGVIAELGSMLKRKDRELETLRQQLATKDAKIAELELDYKCLRLNYQGSERAASNFLFEREDARKDLKEAQKTIVALANLHDELNGEILKSARSSTNPMITHADQIQAAREAVKERK